MFQAVYIELARMEFAPRHAMRGLECAGKMNCEAH